MKHLLLVSFMILMMGFSKAQPVVHYVTTTGAGDKSGVSWANASDDLQQMISDAQVGELVFVAKGIYKRPLAGQYFTMVYGVKIYGGFNGTEKSLAARNLNSGDTTTLAGNGASVMRNVNTNLNASALLDGFKITNGTAITTADIAAGMGGGICNIASSPALRNLTVVNNMAESGGGITNFGCAPRMENITIIHNSANVFAGGLFNLEANPTLTNINISGNTSDVGGGMVNSSASGLVCTNTVISGNRATTKGGGLYLLNSFGVFNNVTISGNLSPDAGGVYNTGMPTLNNCIIFGNSSGLVNDEAGAARLRYCLVQDSTSTSNGNLDGTTNQPLFQFAPVAVNAPFSNGNYQLQSTSPLIDKGTPLIDTMDLPLIDLAGNPRVSNFRIDMGAYEFQGDALPVTVLNFRGTLQNGVATLKWQSGVEVAFKAYQLEKSIDGNHYNFLAAIAAKGSNHHYDYTVPQTQQNAWYRLRLIDLSENSEYHNSVVSLQQKMEPLSILVYPNPASAYINVRVPAAGKMQLYDVAGRLVRTAILQIGINRIDIRTLSAGVYYGAINGQRIKFVRTTE